MINQIGSGAFGNFFARLLNVDGQMPVRELAPEVMPVTSPWERPEFWALLGGRLGHGHSAAAAGGAGVASFFYAFVPTGSSQIAVIERIILGSAVVYTWGLTPANAGFNTVIGAHRDTRNIFNPAAVGNGLGVSLREGSAVGGIISAPHGSILGPAVVPIDQILTAGWAFGVDGPDNTAINVTIQWRERNTVDTELNLR